MLFLFTFTTFILKYTNHSDLDAYSPLEAIDLYALMLVAKSGKLIQLLQIHQFQSTHGLLLQLFMI